MMSVVDHASQFVDCLVIGVRRGCGLVLRRQLHGDHQARLQVTYPFVVHLLSNSNFFPLRVFFVIGRKTSRVLVTGGDDNKVNIWAIGKPNAIMCSTSDGPIVVYLFDHVQSLSGHMSAVESVSFDSSEVLVAAGAASGSIKLWDLEEAKSRTTFFIFSWEPIRCHDAVDVGWSRLSDMNIHEGKLLGCSYNQSCVGVWVVDLSWCMLSILMYSQATHRSYVPSLPGINPTHNFVYDNYDK
ncbi:hypothetical protein GW17_00004131 [Ensete ventricosum]|nr:hypothetical protein GW17_00004131 [Ensete ventricosum]